MICFILLILYFYENINVKKVNIISFLYFLDFTKQFIGLELLG